MIQKRLFNLCLICLTFFLNELSRCWSEETTKFAKIVAHFQETGDLHLVCFQNSRLFLERFLRKKTMEERRNVASFINSFFFSRFMNELHGLYQWILRDETSSELQSLSIQKKGKTSTKGKCRNVNVISWLIRKASPRGFVTIDAIHWWTDLFKDLLFYWDVFLTPSDASSSKLVQTKFYIIFVFSILSS